MRSTTGLAVLFAVLAAVLQIAVAPNIAIAGVAPNFLLLMVVISAMVDGPRRGMSMGFALGFVYDLTTTGPVGPGTLVFTLVGFMAGQMRQNMFSSGWIAPLMVFSISTLSAEVLYVLVGKVLGSGVPFWSSFLLRMLPSTVYDTVLALALFPWITDVVKRRKRMGVSPRF